MATLPPAARRRALQLEDWLHRPHTARIILVGSLLLTALAWLGARHYAREEGRERFERRTDDMHGRIEHRMAAYEAILRGGVALFAAQPDTSRLAWKRYVDTLDLEQRYPGIQGFGYAELIRPGNLAVHEAAVRTEGFADYQVRPPGERDMLSAIVYLEPFVKRNLRAFGFDMLSEARRREAMLRARDHAQPAMSDIVTLVQEDGRDVQKGFLLYLPVFRDGMATPDMLRGWVYAPFRVGDLMAGIVGNEPGHIVFRVRMGTDAPGTEPFYSSARAVSAAAHEAFHRERALVFGGRSWTVTYEGTDDAADGNTWVSNGVAAAGLVVDLVLYWSIASLARRKRRVEGEVAQRSAELAARSAWLEAVSGLSPDGVLVFERSADAQHRLVMCNPAFTQWLGWPPDALQGLTEAEVDLRLAPLAEPGVRLPSLRAGDATVQLATPARRVLRRGLRQGPLHRVHYFQDVTHESEVDRLKNEFLSTAAHELRTPLASVYGYAELLVEMPMSEAQRSRSLRVLYRQAGVLKHLVDELLDLARLDARGAQALDLAPCDLHQVAELAMESVADPGQVPRVFVPSRAAALPVHGDAAKLRQAVANLLSNALKYSPAGSPVTLSLDEVSHDGRPHARLRVADRGIGMTPEQCRRAFQRFYRADPSGHVLGAGLGLAITREIVQLHQGRVALQSEQGRGTEVCIELPLAPQPLPLPAPHDPIAA